MVLVPKKGVVLPTLLQYYISVKFSHKMEWTSYFLIMSLLQQGGLCLELRELRVPNHAIRDQTVQLECHYDLDGETLYSVKWYKNGNEFYRFVPRDNPPSQAFPLAGISVDMDNSTDTKVILESVQLSTSGNYRCEVSGEAPSFETVSEHSTMTVVALPEKGPKISGGSKRYQIGETVRVNCTSSRSKPAAQLNWFINSEPANKALLRGPYIEYTGREGLETSILGLEFKVLPRHFKHRGDLKLKCLASIATIYSLSNEQSVGDRPVRAEVLESRGTVAPIVTRADKVQAGSGCLLPANIMLVVICCITFCVFLK